MRRLAACALAAASLASAGCGSSGHQALAAKGPALPALGERCGGGRVDARVGWFRTPDGVTLDGAELGDGDTGVVLAHESPADLCGWVPYAKVLARSGFRPADRPPALRPVALAGQPEADRSLHARPGRRGRRAPARRRQEGLPHGRLLRRRHQHGRRLAAGVEDRGGRHVSGETELGNQYGGPQSELDAIAAVPRLRAPFLIVSARDDGYLPPADARRLLRLAGSAHKQLALFPGNYHGWDILSAAPYRAAASKDVIAFLRRYS